MSKKWEYLVLDSADVPRESLLKGRSREAVQNYLNQLGEEGWEVVNLDFLELETRLAFLGVAKREKK